VVEQTYRMGRFIFGVRTNSEPFAAWLAETFGPYTGTPQIRKCIFSVLVADEAPGVGKRFHILYKQESVVVRTLDIRELVEVLRAEFESLLFTHWDEGIYMEGTLVSRDGVTALLPTMDLVELNDRERARVGIPAGGRVAIDADSGRLMPVPPRLTIPAEALARLPGRNGRPAPEQLERPPAGIDVVCLAGVETGDLVVRPISRAAALAKLLRLTVINAETIGPRALEGLSRLTEGAACFELGEDTPQLLRGLAEAIESRTAQTGAA
jgi:hypothetical protein